MSKLFKSLFCLAVAAFVAMPAVSAFADDSFEYHGYMRTGTSFNENLNNPQGNIGLVKKYRLGNETNNTYVETQFDKIWKGEGYTAKFVAMFDWRYDETHPYGNDGETGDGGTPRARQIYVTIDTGDMSFWVGQRYYAREDIHVIDLYYRDLTSRGAGVEGINLGFANLNFAWLTRADRGTQLTDDGDNVGFRMTHGWDLQLTDIELGFASLNVEGMLQRTTGDDNNDAYNSIFSQVSLNLPTFIGMNGFLKVVGQFAKGPMASGGLHQMGTFGTGSWGGNADNKSDYAVRGIIWGAAQITPELSISPVVLYHYFNDDVNDNKQMWLSAGARAKYALSNTFAIQLEVGHELVKDDNASTTAQCTKVTVAPTVTFGSGFWARPELRAYATFGIWNDDAISSVGAASSTDDKNAFAFGFQAEAWW